MAIWLNYLRAKLLQRDTYIVTLIVGTLINLYGQLIVPILRGNTNPIEYFLNEVATKPVLALLSIALGYVFPFCVGVLTAVLTRHQNRWIELRSRFPDQKPDPVFLANEDGAIIDAGANTRTLMNSVGFNTAQCFMSDEVWQQVLQRNRGETSDTTSIEVYIEALDQNFVLSQSSAGPGQINIYLSRMPDRSGS